MTLLVQVTDTHIVEPGQRLYGLADTAAHLADAVAQINAMEPQPDLVLFTGDLIEHPGPRAYGHFARLVRPLRAPVCVMPGNHDDPVLMAAQFAGTSWFPAAAPTFQYAIEHLPFRVLALNSHIDDSELPYFPPERLDWLEARLAESTRPTLIAVHHPPMRTGVEFIDMAGSHWYAGIGAAIARSPQVKLVICGHGHADIIGTLSGVPVYMAGSTAHQLVAMRGNHMAPGFDNRPGPPVLHHWLGDGFVSGSHAWPAWVEDHRIDVESGMGWDELKERMRGTMR